MGLPAGHRRAYLARRVATLRRRTAQTARESALHSTGVRWPAIGRSVRTRSRLKARAGGRALIPKNAFGWPTLCGFLHLRPIPLHSRDERWGRSLLLFSNFHFS